ncbi:MAG: adenylate/guanylate cyclase domain-containing protein [Bacteroidetes bacterium]|nr:adenylate/guanylate cyclase domain-containing protein [Bacteroidota bacterium]
MANLDLIKQLNTCYGKSNPLQFERRYFSLNESLDPGNIQKAISDSIASLGPEFTRYFDYGLPADVVLLFIDVCNFSERYGELDGEEIGEYFDEFYNIVIPLIYKYGGEIDKIMGDGIICVFGPPFQNLTLNENIIKANNCSKDIIRATNNTIYSSKIAMHCGTINYFKNKSGLYREFTLIGKPLTELFRLESISNDQCINYYDDTDIRTFYEEIISSNNLVSRKAKWSHYQSEIDNLKGVTFERFYSIEYND